VGCSRTDAGVHAAGYVANFFTTTPAPNISIARSVGARLPKDMTLLHLAEVPLTFHATRTAVSKLYRYRIHNTPSRPSEHLAQRFVYHFWQPLNIDAMRRASEAWIGEHDFTSFASAGNDRQSNVRTIRRIELYREDQEIRMDIEGEGFLYKQVRNMMGTLVEIGRGHWEPAAAQKILEGRHRSLAGPTAPARGLCLQWVRYDIPGLPAPSAEQLDRAARATPPAGAERYAVDDKPRSTAPMPPGFEIEEEPPA
jgi:tRNA pseudouridine38-40 synthase